MGMTGQVAKKDFIVMGSVGDSKYRSPRETFLPIFYTSLHGSDAEGAQIYFYVKTIGNPDAIIRSVRAAMFHLDPQVPFSNVETMSERMDESLWQERLLVTLATTFSTISILVAGVGMYGLLAYDASRRIREFGIRAALGATKQDIGKLMVWELATILGPGLALGIIGCRVLASAIAPALYEIGPYDAIAWAGSLFAVVATGAVALLQPMRRALAAEPAIVLREE
jgi:putative ABC transport system permease protein